MSKKSAKIAALLEGIRDRGCDSHYAGFFECFNRQWFFEAHDVLEELWLTGGKSGPNYAFHKGLIQLAGAFVHLQKDRLRPAVALFNLAEANLRNYPSAHDRLDVAAVLDLIRTWRGWVESGGFESNPLGKHPAPQLGLRAG